MRHTPLHDVHLASGAKMVDFGGWRMPVQYGPILDEIRCVRGGAGLFDLSHMGRVRIAGPDAVRFVDRVASCFCARIPKGAIRYGLLCREDGNPIDDLLVYRDDKSVVSLVLNAANTERDLSWLREHTPGLDVTIEDRTEELAMIAIQGPLSRSVLQREIESADLEALGYYRFLFATLCGIDDVRVSRTGYTGEVGYEVYLPAAESERVWKALLAAGGAEGLRPIGLGARDTLRLEAGMALYGHEIDEAHNAIEAGLAFAVSFVSEKGDWIGRSSLARIAENPTRALVGITTDGVRVPRQGYSLWRGDQEVGEVCSGAVSPTLDTYIGTAYLPLELAHPGQEVDMELRGKRQACTVVELPFYSRTRS